jgi:hypothetical protein
MGLLKWLRKSAKISGGFGVFQDIYQPSSTASRIVIEQQREAIKPKPSPEDKKKPGHQ